MELLWRVELENGATVTGSTLMQPGENRIVCELPDDTLKSVTGAMLWDTEPGEKRNYKWCNDFMGRHDPYHTRHGRYKHQR